MLVPWLKAAFSCCTALQVTTGTLTQPEIMNKKTIKNVFLYCNLHMN